MGALRRSIALLGAAALLGLAGPCMALDPARTLRQFHHTAWTIENGAPADVWALAQTPDGYLWLGAGAGLYRFDGVRFEKFRPTDTDRFAASNINALWATSDGDLWIGFSTGAVSLLRGGRIRNFSLGLSGSAVNTIVQDQGGAIWAAANGPERGGLARFANGRWAVIGAAWGVPKGPIYGLAAARDGSVWATTADRLLVLRRGARRFEAVNQAVSPETRVDQAPDGRLWFSRGAQGLHPLGPSSIRPLAGGRSARPEPPATGLTARRALFDREGGYWATDARGGVMRVSAAPGVRPGRAPDASLVENFSLKDGLSSAAASPLLEDREGDIWVGTNLGLDRFRSANVVAAPGVPVTALHGFQAVIGADGEPYVATDNAVFKASPEQKARTLAQMPSPPTFLHTDRQGVLWLGTRDGLYRLKGGRLRRETSPVAKGRLLSWIEFPSGVVWVSVAGSGVFERRAGRWGKISPFADLDEEAPSQMALDRQGGVWTTRDEAVTRREGLTRRVFSAADGLAVGGVEIISAGGREILIGGDDGLARFDGRRFETLSSRRFAALSRISGIVQTSRGETWLNGIAGVVRVSTADLDAAFDHPDRPLRYDLFDLGDGLPGVAQQDGDTQTALEATDGRVWFVTSHGIAWIDPSHLRRNPLAPAVAIRALMADGEEHAFPTALRLRAGVSNVQIDYTAMSLSIPERVRFRYRLDGIDKALVDPGTRRQAFYTTLGPGAYRFHLIAANNDGVWNRTGADVRFTIPPTFLQSGWFQLLCALAGATVLWLFYSMRLRQVADRIQMRLEERLSERERIARELHDTLLQGFQGLVLRFGAAAESISPPQPASTLMQGALDQADAVLIEARDRVLDLRSGPQDRSLAQLFSNTAERLMLEPRIRFRVIVEGTPRALHPIVRDEVSKIGEEALINARQHSQAGVVEVSLSYLPRELRVHVRDDGVGIETEVLAGGGRSGHFGLLGIRERARRVQGELAISSRPGAGTEIGLTIPAHVAYIRPEGPGWRRALRVMSGLGGPRP